VHEEARRYVEREARLRGPFGSVLEIGSRDINGTPRPYFPGAEYVGLDLRAGPGVDVVADASTWEPDREYDCVVSTECLEHAPRWADVLATAARALRPGGVLILTAATDPRAPHSGVEDRPKPLPDEHYANIPPGQLECVLERHFSSVAIATDRRHGDVYAAAVK
jgi:SAM-dependent methyltransferase